MKQARLYSENTYMKDSSKDYQYIVVGLGKTGLSCATYLYAHGYSFAIADSRDIPPCLQEIKTTMPEVDLYLGEFNPTVLSKAESLLLSPGVSQAEPAISSAKQTGVELIGDIELFAQQVNKPVIAITGSNGKSTVTTLVAELLEAAGYRVKAGGNLGMPALDLLDDDNTDVYVLELSSFQLETLSSLNPVSAVMLNISADHMDRYNTLDEYAAAKAKVYQGDGIMVINHDDAYSATNKNKERENICFSVNQTIEQGYYRKKVDGVYGLYKDNECLIEEDKLKIKGLHNIANVLAALALIDSFKIEKTIIRNALMSFKGLAHRCEFVAKHNGVVWYNDSKGTNVGASCASILGLSDQGEIILLAGGDAKGAEFTELAKACEGKVITALVFGQDADKIYKSLHTIVECIHVEDLNAAVSKANTIAQTGDVVLLSPACASLDMFKNYEQRGDAFVSAVNALVESN